jgi:type II secretory pathway pseudopilin PulG
MNKSVIVFILVGLLITAGIYSSSQYYTVKRQTQELQEIKGQYQELEESYKSESEKFNSKFDYLSKQYRELELQYLRLEYRTDIMENTLPIDKDVLKDTEWLLQYWKDAYEAKPGPWQTVREFRSEEELKLWLSQDNTDSNEYITNQFDCDDFAKLLQARAYADGYVMSVALVTQGENDWHFDNGCFIGNKFYYIDPQNDRYWMRCQID